MRSELLIERIKSIAELINDNIDRIGSYINEINHLIVGLPMTILPFDAANPIEWLRILIDFTRHYLDIKREHKHRIKSTFIVDPVVYNSIDTYASSIRQLGDGLYITRTRAGGRGKGILYRIGMGSTVEPKMFINGVYRSLFGHEYIPSTSRYRVCLEELHWCFPVTIHTSVPDYTHQLDQVICQVIIRHIIKTRYVGLYRMITSSDPIYRSCLLDNRLGLNERGRNIIEMVHQFPKSESIYYFATGRIPFVAAKCVSLMPPRIPVIEALSDDPIEWMKSHHVSLRRTIKMMINDHENEEMK